MTPSASVPTATYVGRSLISRRGMRSRRLVCRTRHAEGCRQVIATSAWSQSSGSHHTVSSTFSPGAIAGRSGYCSAYEAPVAAEYRVLPWVEALHPTPVTLTRNAVPSPALASVAFACGGVPLLLCASGAVHTERAPKVTHSARRVSILRHHTATSVVAVVARAVATVAASPTASQKSLDKSTPVITRTVPTAQAPRDG